MTKKNDTRDGMATAENWGRNITQLLEVKPTDLTPAEVLQLEEYWERKVKFDRFESHEDDEEPPLTEEVRSPQPRKQSPFTKPTSKKEAKQRIKDLENRLGWIGRFKNHVLEDGQLGYMSGRAEFRKRKDRMPQLNKEARAIELRISRLRSWIKSQGGKK